MRTSPSLDDAREPATLTEQLGELVRERYERKRAEAGDPRASASSSASSCCASSTRSWVEHLTAVDDMRRGIGLRAYSQREPLNEFKIEAYRMFDELKSTIRHDVTHTIFRVIAPAAAAASRGRWRATSPRAARAVDGRAAGPGQRRRRQRPGQRRRARARARAGPKIGRNDPCWCGSGKKYKKCHGA